jgi:hypothetical protein
LLIRLPRYDPSPAQPDAGHDPLLQHRVYGQTPNVQSLCDLGHGDTAASRWGLARAYRVNERIGHLGLIQDGKQYAEMANVLPQMRHRHVFASRRIVAERVTFPLPFRRTGVMDRHARINRRTGERPQ